MKISKSASAFEAEIRSMGHVYGVVGFFSSAFFLELQGARNPAMICYKQTFRQVINFNAPVFSLNGMNPQNLLSEATARCSSVDALVE